MATPSQFANDLRCQYCGKQNAATQWPTQGDMVPFYYQKDPGRFQVPVSCPHCRKTWYVVWDDDPGHVSETGYQDNPIKSEHNTLASRPEDKIRWKCGNCGKRLRTTPDKAGKKCRCTQCGTVQHIPKPITDVEETPQVIAVGLLETTQPVGRPPGHPIGPETAMPEEPDRDQSVCPYCRENIAVSSRRCPVCGKKLTEHALEKEWNQIREKRANCLWMAWGFCLGGVVLNLLIAVVGNTVFQPQQSQDGPGEGLILCVVLIPLLCFCIGFGSAAVYRGQSPAWGLLGAIPCLGFITALIVVLSLRDRNWKKLQRIEDFFADREHFEQHQEKLKRKSAT